MRVMPRGLPLSAAAILRVPRVLLASPFRRFAVYADALRALFRCRRVRASQRAEEAVLIREAMLPYIGVALPRAISLRSRSASPRRSCRHCLLSEACVSLFD